MDLGHPNVIFGLMACAWSSDRLVCCPAPSEILVCWSCLGAGAGPAPMGSQAALTVVWKNKSKEWAEVATGTLSFASTLETGLFAQIPPPVLEKQVFVLTSVNGCLPESSFLAWANLFPG